MKITQKPKLHEEIAEALPPEVVLVEEDTEVYTPIEREQEELEYQLRGEIEEYRVLLEDINFNLPQRVETDTGTITPVSLSSALETSDPIYAEAATAWNEQSWEDGNNLSSMVYTSVNEVFYELQQSLLDFGRTKVENERNNTQVKKFSISENKNKTSTGGKDYGPKTSADDVIRKQLTEAQKFRDDVYKALEESRQHLKQCLIRKYAYAAAGADPSHPGYSPERLLKVRELLNTLRTGVQLAIALDSANFSDLYKQFTGRLQSLLEQNVLNELLRSLSQVEQRIVQPLLDVFQELENFSQEETCNAFDSVISLLEQKAYEARMKYVHALYDAKNSVSARYQDRFTVLERSTKRLELQKQLMLLDTLLAILEQVTDSQDVESRLTTSLKEQTSRMFMRKSDQAQPEKGQGTNRSDLKKS